jgi:hypothetical protein
MVAAAKSLRGTHVAYGREVGAMGTMSTIQRIAVVFGVVYLLIGILGFIPGITVESGTPGVGLLLGIFSVNLLHNLAHILFGIALVWAGMTSVANTVMVGRALTVVFVLLIILGLVMPTMEALPLNLPDTVLHLLSALVSGYLGFAAGARRSATV